MSASGLPGRAPLTLGLTPSILVCVRDGPFKAWTLELVLVSGLVAEGLRDALKRSSKRPLGQHDLPHNADLMSKKMRPPSYLYGAGSNVRAW